MTHRGSPVNFFVNRPRNTIDFFQGTSIDDLVSMCPYTFRNYNRKITRKETSVPVLLGVDTHFTCVSSAQELNSAKILMKIQIASWSESFRIHLRETEFTKYHRENSFRHFDNYSIHRKSASCTQIRLTQVCLYSCYRVIGFEGVAAYMRFREFYDLKSFGPWWRMERLRYVTVLRFRR